MSYCLQFTALEGNEGSSSVVARVRPTQPIPTLEEISPLTRASHRAYLEAEQAKQPRKAEAALKRASKLQQEATDLGAQRAGRAEGSHRLL